MNKNTLPTLNFLVKLHSSVFFYFFSSSYVGDMWIIVL